MQSATNGQTIEAENLGPIKRASIPYLRGGGVVELNGKQGIGKTILLEAIDSAITGKGRPPVRDGQLHGSLEGLGVIMKIGKQCRRGGEPEVVSIEGRLSVADLVDPQIKDTAAADARRIKALLGLAGAAPNAESFYSLFGGRAGFEEVVRASVVDADDLVVMADWIKRDCDAAARKAIDRALHCDGRAQAEKAACSGVDLNAEHDEATLFAEYKAAMLAVQKIEDAQADATKQRAAHGQAALALANARKEYKGPSPAEAEQAVREAGIAVGQAVSAVEKARHAFELALAEQRADQDRLTAATDANVNAIHHAKMTASWEEQVRKSVPDEIPQETIDAAATAMKKASDSHELGILIREAIAHKLAADEAFREAEAHRSKADKMKEAAKGTDQVLSQIVSTLKTPLRVEGGRLVLDTHRGSTYFSDLSDGERWKLALDIAIDIVGERGVLMIPQWAWSELQPKNKMEIADRLRERGALAYTAVATDDEELTTKIY